MRGLGILVVEDDHDIRETLKELLEEHGHVVSVAGNGREALDVMRAGLRPELILLDLTMPVMDGFAFREAQRADPALARVPVVVMTADGRLEESRARIGCTHAMRKPMKLQELLEIIATYGTTD